MSEGPNDFSDEIPVEANECRALLTSNPLPPLRIQCQVTDRWTDSEVSCSMMEDGTLTTYEVRQAAMGWSERDPEYTYPRTTEDLRGVVDAIVAEQLWLYPDPDDWEQRSEQLFGAPTELRVYVLFPGRRYMMARATGAGLLPVTRVAQRLWGLLPTSVHLSRLMSRVG